MIRLRIEEESAFYNSLDPSNERISNDVYSYLKTFCSEIEEQPQLYDTIQILCSGPFDTERAKQSIIDAVDREQKNLDRQIKTNRKRMRVNYLIGAILSVLGFVLAKLLDVVVLQMVSFLGTIAARDAFTIQTKLNPDLEHLKNYVEPFRKMKLEVIREEQEEKGR